MTASPERSSQSDSEEPATRPPAIQNLGTAETALALADVRDLLEVLERSRRRQLRDGGLWTVSGGFFLLLSALTGSGAPLFLMAALFPVLAAAHNFLSYLKSRARWRELRARLGVAAEELPPLEP